jgi:hypothetical protein
VATNHHQSPEKLSSIPGSQSLLKFIIYQATAEAYMRGGLQTAIGLQRAAARHPHLPCMVASILSNKHVQCPRHLTLTCALKKTASKISEKKQAAFEKKIAKYRNTTEIKILVRLENEVIDREGEVCLAREGTNDLILKDVITGKRINKVCEVEAHVLLPLLDQELIYVLKVSSLTGLENRFVEYHVGYRYMCYIDLFIPPAHVAARDQIGENIGLVYD